MLILQYVSGYSDNSRVLLDECVRKSQVKRVLHTSQHSQQHHIVMAAFEHMSVQTCDPELLQDLQKALANHIQ